MGRLLLAVIGLLLASVVALLLALGSGSFVIGAAHWAVATFTDLRLELRNPRVDFYAGTVAADEIHLLPQGTQGPALLSVLDASATIPIGMPFGANPDRSFLRVGSVLVYVSDSDKAADPQPMQWLGYLGWLPAELRIGQFHLVTASASTWIFPLKQVHGDRLDNSNYRLTAQADYEGEPLGASVDLLAVDKGWGITAAEARIDLSAPASGSEFTLTGTLEGSADEFRYNFALNAFYRDISDFLKGFEGGKDLAGELRLQGTMVGDTSGFVVSDATFLLINLPDYAFQASGKLQYQLSGETSIDLEALGELASLTYLVNWIDVDVGDFGRAQSSIRLSGSLDKPVIDEFRLSTSNDEGLTVSMSGRLNLFEAETESGPGTNAISLVMQGPSLAVLQRWLGEIPFEPGPWRLSGQLAGDRKTLSLQDITLEAGTPGSMELRATGAVGRITSPQAPEQNYAFHDILLLVTAHAPDSAEIGALLGRGDIPPYQELDASVTLSGSGEALQLSEGRLTVTASDLQATIGPLNASLRPAETNALSGLSAPILIKLSDTAALSQYTARYTRQPMPVLGPLTVSATLTQKGQLFQMADLVATAGEGDMEIQAKGQISNLANFSDVALTGTIRGLDIRTLISTLPTDFRYQEPLGDVAGSFKLVQAQGKWTLSKLVLAGGDDKTPLTFSIDGEINDLTGFVTADLGSEFQVKDPALLEALSGRPLRSLSGSLTLATSPEQIRSTLRAQIGETRINGDCRLGIAENNIHDMQLTLTTPHLHLQDFGFDEKRTGDAAQVKTREETPRNAKKQEQEQESVPEAPAAPAESGTMLARLRQQAPPFPLDLTLEIGGISGESSSIDSLQARVTGIDNRYTLEQFSASYNRALAEIRGVIDLNTEPPIASLAGQVSALPLGALLADVGANSNVSGALTILGGVTLMGDNTQALLGSLNGSIAIALENAVIEGAAYDLLATDLLAWIYSGALTEKSTHLDCTMAKFQLRQGVASTDSLYIESSKMVATGKAEFDLVKRRMDLRITPLSKSRLLQVPSEVRLKGDMSNPRADISPINAVADATSAALMLIPSLTLKLFGLNPGSTEKQRPCQADLGN